MFAKFTLYDYITPMYIEIVPNRKSRPTVLLREGWREGGKVRKRTLANLSMLPPEAIETLRRALRGETLVSAAEHLEIERSLSHGTVAAVVGMVRKLGLDTLIASRRSPERDYAVALIAGRVIEPTSRLAMERILDPQTATSTLGPKLGVEGVSADQLYKAMDWLSKGKDRIEEKLVRRHLSEGTLLLYDLTSVYFEGRNCPLARHGYSRDKKRGKRQIVVGLLCTRQGCPVSVEVYPGNTPDKNTLASQILKVRERWGLRRVVWVGDRGLLTQDKIDKELRPVKGLGWITALPVPAIQRQVEKKALQLSLFDEQDLFEFTSADYPDERLVACRNPLLAADCKRKRQDLLEATEAQLEKIVAAVRRPKRGLKGKEKIALRVGKIIDKYKVGKHFELNITEDAFSCNRKQDRIDAEARLDGIYVIRSSEKADHMPADDLVRCYKELSVVERAFQSLKTLHLQVRPIRHRLAERVKIHVFICMLAYYVTWHMKQALAPILFQDDDPTGAQQQRESVVSPARRSPRAIAKIAKKRTEEGFVVHSFETLLKDLATLTSNKMRFGKSNFVQLSRPTPLQKKAFELLEVPLRI